jgi:chromosome segregation ATPase
LRSEVSSLRATVMTLTAEAERTAHQRGEVGRLYAAQASLELAVEMQRASAESAARERDALVAAVAERDARIAELADAAEELGEVRRERDELEAALGAQQAECDELVRLLEAVRARVAKLGITL